MRPPHTHQPERVYGLRRRIVVGQRQLPAREKKPLLRALFFDAHGILYDRPPGRPPRISPSRASRICSIWPNCAKFAPLLGQVSAARAIYPMDGLRRAPHAVRNGGRWPRRVLARWWRGVGQRGRPALPGRLLPNGDATHPGLSQRALDGGGAMRGRRARAAHLMPRGQERRLRGGRTLSSPGDPSAGSGRGHAECRPA